MVRDLGGMIGKAMISKAALAGTGLLVVALATTACGGPNSAAGGGTATTAGVSTAATMMTTTNAQASTAGNNPAVATSAPANAGGGTGGGSGECKAANLRLSLGQGDAAMSHQYIPLRFTNTGQTPCVMIGFPGVSYVTGDNGQQVGAPAVRDGSVGAQVTLAPGQTAAATVTEIQVGVFDPNVCRPTPVRGLRVYAPDDTASMFIAQSTTGCAGNPPDSQLHVQTVKAG